MAASAQWPTLPRSTAAAFGKDYDVSLLVASILGWSLLHGLLITGLVVAVACFVAAHVKGPGLRLILLLAGSLSLIGGGWGNPADLAQRFVTQFIVLGVLALGVRYVMRFNILGCFLVVAGTSVLGGASELLSQPDSFYRTNAYPLFPPFLLLFPSPFVPPRLAPSPQATGP